MGSTQWTEWTFLNRLERAGAPTPASSGAATGLSVL